MSSRRQANHDRRSYVDLSSPLFDLRNMATQGRPSFTDRQPLPLRRLPDPEILMGARQEYYYMLGECTCIVTDEGGTYPWRLSIAHPRRYPLWDEICECRYRLLPAELTMALILPPPSEYVNVHENCFQLVQIPLPDTTATVERSPLP
jgi:hypothetical protein